MLKEINKMEQRYDAVLGVIRDGYSVKEIAEAYGVSRQSVHAWLARYEQGGLEALAERSHRPRRSPLQMAPALEVRVVELRRAHPLWGPVRLLHQLGRESSEPLPSLSGIYRALVRHHLIEPKASRKRLPTYSAGNGAAPTSCGRWTSWVGSS